jgi:hypothetical protein
MMLICICGISGGIAGKGGYLAPLLRMIPRALIFDYVNG